MAYDESLMYDEPNEIVYGITIDLWLERIFIYYFIFAFILAISSYLDFIYTYTEEDSARYMLSALVQCEAAVFALVITLSLVAVQISASSYSARVIHLFKGLPDLWILVLIYTITIFYSLAVLKMIDQSTENLKYNISISYLLGLYAFLALVPYFLTLVELTNPYTLISLLSKNINEDRILSCLHIGDQKDPFQPLMDIIYTSINKYDIGIVIEGLEAMESKIKFILNDTKGENDIVYRIIDRFLSHVSGLGKMAGDRRDEDVANMVEGILGRIGTDAAKNDLNKVAMRTIWSLGPFGINCAENYLEYPTSRAILSLESIGTIFMERRFEEGVDRATISMSEIGSKAAKNQLRVAVADAAMSLRSVAVKAIEGDIKKVTDRSIWALNSMGLLCAENELELPATNVVLSFEDIGIAYIKNNLDEKAAMLTVWFDIIGFEFCKKKFEIATTQVIESLKKIGIEAASNKQQKTITRVAESLGSIGICAAENNLEKLTIRIVESLGSLGLTFAKENSENGATSVTQSLEKIASKYIDSDITIKSITYIRNIGINSIRNRLHGAVGQVAESFAMLIDKSVEQKIYKNIPMIAYSLGKIGVESVMYRDLARETHIAADRLEKTIRIVDCIDFNNRSDMIAHVVEDLGTIGKKAAENGSVVVASRVAYAFGNIGPIALKNNINKETLTSYLKSILTEAAKASESDKGMVVVCYQIGRSFNELNYFLEAEEALKKAIEIDSQHYLSWLQLHNALESQGKHDEAKEALAEYKKLTNP